MIASVARVILVGWLDRDPEALTLPDGRRVVNVLLKTTQKWADRDGAEKHRDTRHRVAIFNENLAKVALDYLHRGSAVFVCGALQQRSWVDASGGTHAEAEIVLGPYHGELVLFDRKQEQ
jgi:single-strand DNA-binding protein